MVIDDAIAHAFYCVVCLSRADILTEFDEAQRTNERVKFGLDV